MNELTVNVGETFDISLEETPTAGFRWEVIVPPEASTVISQIEDKRELPTARVAGGSTHHHFYFRALSQGQVSLLFRYRRSWETNAREQRVISIRVEHPTSK